MSKFRKFRERLLGLSVMAAIFLFTCAEALASTPDITSGLRDVHSSELAGKIVSIATTGAAVAGAVAALMLTYLGFKLKTSGERDRAETKEQIVWVFVGLALVGCAALIAGFAAGAIKNAA